MTSKPQRYVTNANRMVYRKVGRWAWARPVLERHYEQLFAANTEQNLFRGVYRTFAEAQASAPSSRPLGYDHEGPAQMYRERLERVYTNDYPMLLWLGRILAEEGIQRVFDFGGHVGVARYSFSRYLAFPAELHWTVCDVPAVAQAGTALARERGPKGLTFTTQLADAEGADVFFASGSLQYVETPLAAMLQGLAHPPRHLLINLLPLHPSQECVTLQSIGTAFCPYAVFHREAFVRQLTLLGYTLVDAWDNPDKSCDIPFHPEASVQGYTGLYLRREERAAGLDHAAAPRE